jgi:hypothetical protein
MFIGYFLFDDNIEMSKHKKSIVLNHYLIRYLFYLIIIYIDSVITDYSFLKR